jgi:hypothetical protein
MSAAWSLTPSITGVSPPATVSSRLGAVTVSHACTGWELQQACTTGNATYLCFPLCNLWSAFCTAEAWLSSYAGYQTPAHCIAQAWIAHMQPTKHPLTVYLFPVFKS